MLLLSAAECQRPSNYSSCCCCSWIFRLIYALSTSTTVLPPIFLYILNLSIYQSINPSSSIFFCQSINRPLPFPKYQYINTADPGDGIGPCFVWIQLLCNCMNNSFCCLVESKLAKEEFRHTIGSLGRD